MHEDSMSAIIREYMQSVHGATKVAVGLAAEVFTFTPVGCHNLSKYCHCFVHELTLLEE